MNAPRLPATAAGLPRIAACIIVYLAVTACGLSPVNLRESAIGAILLS
jgi:hypothetical protein